MNYELRSLTLYESKTPILIILYFQSIDTVIEHILNYVYVLSKYDTTKLKADLKAVDRKMITVSKLEEKTQEWAKELELDAYMTRGMLHTEYKYETVRRNIKKTNNHLIGKGVFMIGRYTAYTKKSYDKLIKS